jgi:biopolymer transport protein TolR
MLNPRTKPSNLISSINVTGFLSIMIVLFLTVLFADRGPLYMHPHHGVGIDLPKVGHPSPLRAANREDAMTVAIMRDGKVFFRQNRLSVDQLPGKIRDGLREGAEKKVYIRADARAKYGRVKEALDGIRDAGIENVAFLADQKRSPTP